MLTDDEKAELSALENEERAHAEAQRAAAEKLHLEALRWRRDLRAKLGDGAFCVVETKAGNFALRRPTKDDLQLLEVEDFGPKNAIGLVLDLLIKPTESDARPLLESNPKLPIVLLSSALDLLEVLRESNAKK